MKRELVIALVATGLMLAIARADAYAAAARPITLEEALDLARRHSPRAIAAEGSRRVGAASVRSAYGAFLPSLSLSAGATRQYPARGGTRIENGQVVTLPSEPWSQSAGMSASMTLFAGGSRFFDLRQAKAEAAAADESYATEKYGVELATKERFFAVLAMRETIAAAEARRAAAEEGLEAATARTRARVATRSDSLRAVIEWRNADLALLDARQSATLADASLTRAVGATELVTAVEPAGPDSTSLSLEEAALRTLAADAPSIRSAKARRDAARAALSSSWTGYLPSITASYSRGGSGSSTELVDDLETYSGSLRLSASLPLFDRFSREGAIVRSRVSYENAEANLRDARLAAVETLEQALGSFRTAGARVASQRASVEAAEEDLRVQQERYKTGAGTQLEVLTSQTTLHNARLALIQARFDQRIAKAELAALIGREP
ncbi:MAG TPA: TolC family protein [Candidatus Eisenbacteria bacterium]|nr:TolC family protein [Candidatus Eisenbacteria bacterium]